jgi:3-oxoacyl-[acyl-carrier protein] reductase
MDIEGKAAIVTGSSSPTGIGGETAKLLAQRGCNVVVNYATNAAGGAEVVAACKAAGVEAVAVQGDIAKDEGCKRLVASAIEHFGRLDVLVNNAATTKPVPHARLDLLDAATFERIFAVNVIGNFQMIRAAAEHLKATGDAAIVNISSTAAFHPGGSSIAYGASKGALNTMTLSLARVLAPAVRVNALCPGRILGNWTSKILSKEGYEERLRRDKEEFPLGRAIWPADVAETVLWLIQGATTMTGEVIRMDAGRHLK